MRCRNKTNLLHYDWVKACLAAWTLVPIGKSVCKRCSAACDQQWHQSTYQAGGRDVTGTAQRTNTLGDSMMEKQPSCHCVFVRHALDCAWADGFTACAPCEYGCALCLQNHTTSRASTVRWHRHQQPEALRRHLRHLQQVQHAPQQQQERQQQQQKPRSAHSLVRAPPRLTASHQQQLQAGFNRPQVATGPGGLPRQLQQVPWTCQCRASMHSSSSRQGHLVCRGGTTRRLCSSRVQLRGC
jgi:hypothetical protein